MLYYICINPRHKESLSDDLDLPTFITDSMIKGHMVNFFPISRPIDKRTYGVTDNMQKKLRFGFMHAGKTFALL